MRHLVSALFAGALFGAGLALSGMTDPMRVRGFLDLFGDWDPTLVFVMGSALLVTAIAWRIQPAMARPLFGEKFSLPTRKDLDSRLITGAALFGVGWGIAGVCPGPGFAALALVPVAAVIFLGGMLGGMILFRFTFDK